MIDIVRRIRASLRYEAMYGVASEKEIFSDQVREAADEIEHLRAILKVTPISVYCNSVAEDVLVARLASLSDFSPLEEHYNGTLTWNMDEATEEGGEDVQ